MFELLASVLGKGLELWTLKEKRKYIDKLMDLKTRYNEAINRPDADRNDALTDDLEFQLRVLAIAFTTEAGEQGTKNSP